MKPSAKLAAFALVLATAFGGGAALGAAFAPDSPVPGMDMTPSSTAPAPGR